METFQMNEGTLAIFNLKDMFKIIGAIYLITVFEFNTISSFSNYFKFKFIGAQINKPVIFKIIANSRVLNRLIRSEQNHIFH